MVFVVLLLSCCVVELLILLQEELLLEGLTLEIFLHFFVGNMCVVVKPNRICTFSLDNGDLQNWLLIFLCRVDGVRKNATFHGKIAASVAAPALKKKKRGNR